MIIKKSLLTAAVVAAMTSASAMAAEGSFFNGNGAGFVVGIQGGYADNHWDRLFTSDLAGLGVPASSVKDTGFAARGFAGFDFNRYLGVQAGYTYLPRTTVDGFGGFRIRTYAIDLLAQLSVPVTNVFSLYAKAGGAYLNSRFDANSVSASVAQTNSTIGAAYGVGAAYEVVPNLAIDLSWMRFSGQGRVPSSNARFDYQPSPDMLLLGVSYKFPVRYT